MRRKGDGVAAVPCVVTRGCQPIWLTTHTTLSSCFALVNALLHCRIESAKKGDYLACSHHNKEMKENNNIADVQFSPAPVIFADKIFLMLYFFSTSSTISY